MDHPITQTKVVGAFVSVNIDANVETKRQDAGLREIEADFSKSTVKRAMARRMPRVSPRPKHE
jgi:hypothetical protein